MITSIARSEAPASIPTSARSAAGATVHREALGILHVAETIRGGIATYLNELSSYHEARRDSALARYVVPEDQSPPKPRS